MVKFLFPFRPFLSPVPTLPLYLIYHNLNQITSGQLAALAMWPTSALKAPPFQIGRGFFPWELPTEPVQCERVCVCLRTLGKNLPPPLPLFPTSSPLSPFLSSFFHHLPSFETQYHTLDSLCCHGKEHSFLWRGHTECENAGGSLQNTEQKTRVRKCSNVATA